MLITEPYLDQTRIWPARGRHILAQYDAATIIVYQAYNTEIGHYAVTHQHLGGAFDYGRMSWLKPNFLWMMYRSGWGTKENQQVILALRLRRTFFESLLAQAVPSVWDQAPFSTRSAWATAINQSEVRIQWDPDHDPHGHRVARRALQIGLRRTALAAFGQQELLEVQDLSAFVAEQRRDLAEQGIATLRTPQERVYPLTNPALTKRLGLAEHKE